MKTPASFIALLDWIAPPICSVCTELCCSGSVLCQPCTPNAECRLVMSNEACPTCGERTASNCCPACQLAPLPLRAIRSAWLYESEVEALVKAFKYHGATALAEWMTPSLVETAQYFAVRDWDYLVPIPSAHSRNAARGYAHLQPLARRIAKQLSLPLRTVLTCTFRNRPAQAQLPIDERYANSLDAFSLSRLSASQKIVEGSKILLLDDVCTSGATLSQAAQCLLDAGANAVDAMTFARSSQFRKNRILSRPWKRHPVVHVTGSLPPHPFPAVA